MISVIWIYIAIGLSWAISPRSIMQAYEEAKTEQALQKITSKTVQGNIYETIKQATKEQETKSVTRSINTIHKHIKTQATCTRNITKGDIINIIEQTPYQYLLESISQEKKNKNTKESTQSCKKVMTCLNQPYQKEACVQNIYNMFHNEYTLKQHEEKITKDYYGIQQYSNGTLEDSRYDLMIDIEMIGALLFTSNKETPKIQYYNIPQQTQSTKSNQQDTTKTNTQERPTIDPNIKNTNQPQKTKRTENGSESKKTEEENTKITKNNNTTEQESAKKTHTPTTNIKNRNQKHIFQNTCVPESNMQGTSNKKVKQNTYKTEDDQDDRKQYIKYINGQYTTYTPEQNIQNIQNTSNEESTQDTPTQDNKNTNNNTTLPNNKTIQSCINECSKNYTGKDAIICTTQCTCNTVPKKTSDKMRHQYIQYKIKYCRIPSQTPAPYTTNTPVQSIEEVIDAINNTLSALKQSGSLHKRNQKSEFLDTSLRNTDMGKNFIFNINITTKNSTNTTNNKTKKQKIDTQHKRIMQKSLIHSNDKNKYLIQATSTQKKTHNNTKIHRLEHYNHEIIGTHTFVENMEHFRDEMEKTTEEVLKISNTMNTKAQNAQ